MLTVGELLRKEGKALSLKAAQGVWRGGRYVLGPCSRKLPLEVVMQHQVVPHGAAATAMERDDVLVRLLEVKAHLGPVNAQSFSALTKILPEVLQKAFPTVLRHRFETRRWPAGVGLLQASRGPLLFLLDHVAGLQDQRGRDPVIAVEAGRPKPNNGDFARAFKEAFDRLRRDRPFNMVELAALRSELPHFSREQFDRGLFALRKSREFVLETFEGRHGSLSPEELAAAVREDGRIFAFAARRENG